MSRQDLRGSGRRRIHPMRPPRGALETLTRGLAPEFPARGITANAVLPGVTKTDMNAGGWHRRMRALAPKPSLSSRALERRMTSPTLSRMKPQPLSLSTVVGQKLTKNLNLGDIMLC